MAAGHENTTDILEYAQLYSLYCSCCSESQATFQRKNSQRRSQVMVICINEWSEHHSY